MDSVYEANRSERFTRAPAAPPPSQHAATVTSANSVSASQARAARRREARRDEQAVAVWLRELAGRTR